MERGRFISRQRERTDFRSISCKTGRRIFGRKVVFERKCLSEQEF
jgi:hypothetical protein